MRKYHPAASIFLDLYRISPGRADLDLLHVIAAEYSRLPWENLTKFLKKHATAPDGGPGPAAAPEPGPEPRLRRSEEVLFDHARFGTGGTCFSLTHALRRIVTSVGYEAFPAMADMAHGANVHCGLIVIVDGKRHLIDPGYLVPVPVPLDDGPRTQVSLPGHRLEYRWTENGSAVELWTRNERGDHRHRYRLRPEPVGDAHFERLWADSFDASGMRGLQINRLSDEGRLSAHDYNLRFDSGSEKRNVKLRENYAERVGEHFGIAPELAARALERWKRVRWPSDHGRNRR